VVSAAEVLEQAQAALWLLGEFGGVGSKARKGFGSLQVTLEGASLDLPSCLDVAARLRRRLGLAVEFDPVRAESPALEEAARLLARLPTPWTDPWQALDQVGFVYQEFAQRHKHDPAKVALGLPRKIHGPRDDRAMPGQVEWRPAEWLDFPRRDARTSRANARHASPVHIHLARAEDGSLEVRVLAFPAPFLPDRERSRDFLAAFVQFCREQLSVRASRSARPRPAPAQPAGPVSGRRPVGTPVRVTVLGPHEKGGPGALFVKEEGRPRGLLNAGKPPTQLPAAGSTIDVYVNSDDPRSPQYRWDLPAPPPGRGRRPGAGGPPPRGRR
jgi:CRISPR-associated protein Cmr6